MSSYREKCLEAKGETCIVCGTGKRVEVHHVDGNRLNHDLDNLEPVCRRCHMAIHRGAEGYEEYHEKILPDEERAPGRVLYSFSVPDELWKEWKDTVPRSKRLNDALIELIEADTDGRVDDEN